MKRTGLVVLAGGFLMVSTSCLAGDTTGSGLTEQRGDLYAQTAVAAIKATGPNSGLTGSVEFVQTRHGVKVRARVSGLAGAGRHGFHIHENGSCADGGSAAGGHFNPQGAPHGFLPGDGHERAHLGDMGNIEVGEDGRGELAVVMPGLTLYGEQGIIGRAVIIHEQQDDFGQPVGNAGGRIGCGLIAEKYAGNGKD
jgi:Cu-Zn family superoxide dismutase